MVECDQCGARRPQRGPCPDCGAPPPGTFNSMRQWKDRSRSGEGPAVGRRTSGADWHADERSNPRSSGAGWQRGGGWDDEAGYDEQPSRSGRGRRRNGPDYEEVDLERALVPVQPDMSMMDPSMGGMGGVPGMPGMPQSDEEERSLGIRRPVYIPATGDKRKRKLGTWRVVSGILSIMLVCMASCALAAVVGKDRLAFFASGPISRTPTPVAFSTALVPVTPVATVGPGGGHISNVVTATGVDAQLNPTGLTSHFVVNSNVYVVMGARQIPKGESHTISIRWFLQGQDIQLPANNGTSVSVTGDRQVFFSLVYPQPGLGMVKVYFDKPANDKGDDPKDPSLAATIYFAVEMPTPVPTPKSTAPAGTPSASPSPKAYGAPSALRPDLLSV